MKRLDSVEHINKCTVSASVFVSLVVSFVLRISTLLLILIVISRFLGKHIVALFIDSVEEFMGHVSQFQKLKLQILIFANAQVLILY